MPFILLSYDKPHIPFIAFLVLSLLTIPFDIGVSVVPGWHTTVFSPYFIWKFIVMIVLVFVTIGYWFLSSRVAVINWVLFAVHFGLTIPSIVYPMFSSLAFGDHKGSIKVIEFQMNLVPAMWMFFTIGQILFLVYAIKAIKKD